MNKTLIILVLLILALFGPKNLFATAQYGDLLIIGNDTSWIYSNPLEEYFEIKGSRTIGGERLISGSTALWRGYIATWKIQNDSLFLIRMQTGYRGNSKEIDISKEFDSDMVFAEWVNSFIDMPLGALLQYVHMGYMSIYEGETYYTFKKGILSNELSNHYLIKNDKQTFPGINFLKDTIKNMVLKSISEKDLKQINETNTCGIYVGFSKKRKVSNIELYYSNKDDDLFEKLILSKTREVLRRFPKLMKVNHRGYSPPKLELWFDAHCLKYPKDYIYGCEN
ncbi:MAG: hypothetical protein ACI93N_001547 [Flavobacteriaceae bacterium]|jgi:hypothetical protein